jgi:endonuclease YncB( thermonuclease family)
MKSRLPMAVRPKTPCAAWWASARLRVLLNTPPRDRHGRTIATLYAGEQDIGMALISEGHALVYSVYPFASMPVYLQAQVQARSKSLGLWGNPDVSTKAEALINEWARQGS